MKGGTFPHVLHPRPRPQPEPAIRTNESREPHPPGDLELRVFKRLQEWAENVFCFLRRRARSHLIWAIAEPRRRVKGEKINSATMCYGKCARCIGHSLVWLAIVCIVANILLYFPNGETKYASEDHLSHFVWFFSGIIGGGLLVSHSESFQP